MAKLKWRKCKCKDKVESGMVKVDMEKITKPNSICISIVILRFLGSLNPNLMSKLKNSK